MKKLLTDVIQSCILEEYFVTESLCTTDYTTHWHIALFSCDLKHRVVHVGKNNCMLSGCIQNVKLTASEAM